MSEYISISAIEQQTGIPNPTVRRYIRQHGHHLNVQKQRKGYLMAAESISVLFQIRDLYAKGLGTGEVEDELSRLGTPVTVTVNDNEQTTLPVAEIFRAMTESMNAMNGKIDALLRENEELKHTIFDLRDRLDDREQAMNDRDQALTEHLEQLQQAQLQLTSTVEEKSKKRRWWQRG